MKLIPTSVLAMKFYDRWSMKNSLQHIGLVRYRRIIHQSVEHHKILTSVSKEEAINEFYDKATGIVEK
jgi:hypothetical protein